MRKVSALIRTYGRKISDVGDYLFVLLVLWTLAALIMGWLDFFFESLTIPDVAITSYLILLGIYILHKEVHRWSGFSMSMKPGELVVYVWWASLLLMVIIGFLANMHIPEGVKTLSFDILAALLASEISKSLNSYKRKKHYSRAKGLNKTDNIKPAKVGVRLPRPVSTRLTRGAKVRARLAQKRRRARQRRSSPKMA